MQQSNQLVAKTEQYLKLFNVSVGSDNGIDSATFNIWYIYWSAMDVVSLEVPRRWLPEVRSVKLLGSDKSGHSKRSDRPTVKNTDHGN